jgi:cell wall-associated NlpC family hydrolase
MNAWQAAVNRLPQRIPWVHHGRDLRKGLDCIGLILCVYQLKGINLADLDLPYGLRDHRRGHCHRLLAQLLTRFDQLPQGAIPQDGDLLLVKVGRMPNHLALFVGQGLYHMTAQGLCIAPLLPAVLNSSRVFRSRGS